MKIKAIAKELWVFLGLVTLMSPTAVFAYDIEEERGISFGSGGLGETLSKSELVLLEPSLWTSVVSISPDGRFVLVTTEDDRQQMTLVRTADNAKCDSFKLQYGIDWRADSKYFAAVGPHNEIFIFNNAKGTQVKLSDENPGKGYPRFSWSQSTGKLGVIFDDQMQIIDLASGERVKSIEGKFVKASWSPDDSSLALLVKNESSTFWKYDSASRFIVLDVLSGKEILTDELDGARSYHIGWSPDGWVAVHIDDLSKVTALELATGRKVETFPDRFKSQVPFWTRGVLSPNSRYWAAVRDGWIEFFDHKTGQVARSQERRYSDDYKIVWDARSEKVFASRIHHFDFVRADNGEIESTGINSETAHSVCYFPLTDTFLVFQGEAYRVDSPCIPPLTSSGEYSHTSYIQPKSLTDCYLEFDKRLSKASMEIFKNGSHRKLGCFVGGSYITNAEPIDLIGGWELHQLVENLEKEGKPVKNIQELEIAIISGYWQYLHPGVDFRKEALPEAE